MKNIIGLKELRENMSTFAEKVKKGESFVVVKRSRPLFKITPLSDDSDIWEPVIDFTKLKKGGIPLKHLLSRL